ncbi:hypothetical protein DPMN_024833 [Dreissena polymorpha]|uniref:Saposin B-type domain-containing protein n=1 Tax=Dreissena polymorpha TaxID=45954 RepID=A0A9D4LPM7_DREPO|nr:hypothetical protein DPMN_024833 [Dreissena polymorpha]
MGFIPDQTIKLASTRPVGDLKCDICELIIQELDQLVGQNASAEKINSTIYALCDKLPGTAKTFVSYKLSIKMMTKVDSR